MKPIPGYENYLIDEFGTVINSKTAHIMKIHYINNGSRPYVWLSKNNKSKPFMVAKLVHLVYVSPYQVDGILHKNQDIQDCEDVNLAAGTKSAQRAQALQYKNRPKGVYKWKHKSYTKYRAALKMEGKVKTLGYFETEEEARECFEEAYKQYYGFAA